MTFDPARAQKGPPFRLRVGVALHGPRRFLCRRRRAEPSSFRPL
jgi:hypothetical protein